MHGASGVYILASRSPWRALNLRLETKVARRIVAVAARSGIPNESFTRNHASLGLGLADHMKVKDKLVTLIRLRDMVYFGVRPTLRQCGFPVEIVQELVKEGLIQLGDKKFGEDPDRYVIEEILPAGLSFILQQHALRDRLKQ